MWDDLRTHRDLYEQGNEPPPASIERDAEEDTKCEQPPAARTHGDSPPHAHAPPPRAAPAEVEQWEAQAAGQPRRVSSEVRRGRSRSASRSRSRSRDRDRDSRRRPSPPSRGHRYDDQRDNNNRGPQKYDRRGAGGDPHRDDGRYRDAGGGGWHAQQRGARQAVAPSLRSAVTTAEPAVRMAPNRRLVRSALRRIEPTDDDDRDEAAAAAPMMTGNGRLAGRLGGDGGLASSSRGVVEAGRLASWNDQTVNEPTAVQASAPRQRRTVGNLGGSMLAAAAAAAAKEAAAAKQPAASAARTSALNRLGGGRGKADTGAARGGGGGGGDGDGGGGGSEAGGKRKAAAEAVPSEVEAAAAALKKKQRQVQLEMTKLQAKQSELAASAAASAAAAARAQPVSQAVSDARTVVVTNVHFNASAEVLQAHFRGCGVVLRATLRPGHKAYVELATKEEATRAMLLTGSLLLGRPVSVTRRSDVPKPSPTPKGKTRTTTPASSVSHVAVTSPPAKPTPSAASPAPSPASTPAATAAAGSAGAAAAAAAAASASASAQGGRGRGRGGRGGGRGRAGRGEGDGRGGRGGRGAALKWTRPAADDATPDPAAPTPPVAAV